MIGIIGLGYVGLPLAVAFAESGYTVLGIEQDAAKNQKLARGESYLEDIPHAQLKPLVQAGKLRSTAEGAKLGGVDVVCICVPTPLTKNKEPDLSYVVAASEMISPVLKPGQLIILESTTYPGTTRDVMQPILERSGLKAGQDFYLAYSPERIDPANRDYGVRNTPKLVGGIDEFSTDVTTLLYRQVADTVIPVSSPEVAEMAKVFENVYRQVNIALVNEMARLCDAMGVSVWEVIDAAKTKPYGFNAFYPGPGIGGHCIPLDPYYLASKAREYDFQTRFIELAADINATMPYYVTQCLDEVLNRQGKSLSGARVLVLGVAYKKDVADTRESPALKLIEVLQAKGAEIYCHDTWVDVTPGTRVDLTDDVLTMIDAAVIATDHSHVDYQNVVNKVALVYDARGATRGLSGGNIVRLGEFTK